MSTLDSRATIAFRGPDAVKFLQGQVSADIEKLASGAQCLAGLHNPQGRAIALLQITKVSPEELIASLPRELAAPVGARLRKYVLRAKVRIEDTTDVASALDALDALDAVRAGQPEVYAATSEAFVAQMLNLDLLGAIAFDKGCYTGQEVIARAHYRGRVKRRMQRWANRSGRNLQPGESARGPDGRSLSVVRVASLADGSQEVLAVGTFGALGADADESAAPAAEVRVSGPLPLPYELPE